MNVWLIVAVALALVVALMRIWFRWFSRRPLSSTDDYAMAVDADVDGVTGAGGPAAAAAPSTGSVPGLRPVPPLPPPTAPPAPSAGGRRLPVQRTAADERVPSDGPTSSGGHAVTPRVRRPGS
jgi:hypothetical protein